MTLLYDQVFQPLRGSTAPSFVSNGSIESSANALQSSAVNRMWTGPSGRAVRVAESSGEDYYINFGSSTITAESSDSMLVLGGAVEIFRVQPGQTYVAVQSVSTSTAAVINFTLGTGR